MPKYRKKPVEWLEAMQYDGSGKIVRRYLRRLPGHERGADNGTATKRPLISRHATVR